MTITWDNQRFDDEWKWMVRSCTAILTMQQFQICSYSVNRILLCLSEYLSCARTTATDVSDVGLVGTGQYDYRNDRFWLLFSQRYIALTHRVSTKEKGNFWKSKSGYSHSRQIFVEQQLLQQISKLNNLKKIGVSVFYSNADFKT